MIERLLEILESLDSDSSVVAEFCAKVRALQKDKARLDFLEGPTGGKRWAVGKGWWTLYFETFGDRRDGDTEPEGASSLREAIDRAMKEEGAGSD